ncbi:kinase-like domain-containing protein [Mucidula mucida]|nr:kinase-like domain-containing protein [Mucidula mucida]
MNTFWKPLPQKKRGISVTEVQFGEDDATTTFHLDYDPELVWSGRIIHVNYERNTSVPVCPENDALNRPGAAVSVRVLNEIIPLLPDRKEEPGFWSVHFESSTGEGGITVTKSVFRPFGHAPESFSESIQRLPTVKLESIRKRYFTVYDNIFAIVVQGHSELHVLKLSRGPFFDPTFVEDLTLMLNLPPSPHALRPTAAVLDRRGLLWGYLLPYHSASSLNEVFRASSARRPWSIRLGWALDCALGLEWLHGLGHGWGDVKPNNFILCDDGRCRLIDYAQATCTPAFAAPEFQGLPPSENAPEMTFAGDVFSLGIVLWYIAEEVQDFERDALVPELHWSAQVPDWYKDLVRRCLVVDPDHRPSATSLRSELQFYAEPH